MRAISKPSLSDLKLIDCLENVVYWDPDHARAHLALTEVHLRLFEALRKTGQNRMPLLSIRDAALASDFPSRESLNRWLDRAVGAPAAHLTAALRHCRQSLVASPAARARLRLSCRIEFSRWKPAR